MRQQLQPMMNSNQRFFDGCERFIAFRECLSGVSGVAPNKESTWQIIKHKHLSCPPPPIPDVATCTPVSLGLNFNMAAILLLFPRGTAAEPSTSH